jgi:hypothetical protein
VFLPISTTFDCFLNLIFIAILIKIALKHRRGGRPLSLLIRLRSINTEFMGATFSSIFSVRILHMKHLYHTCMAYIGQKLYNKHCLKPVSIHRIFACLCQKMGDSRKSIRRKLILVLDDLRVVLFYGHRSKLNGGP